MQNRKKIIPFIFMMITFVVLAMFSYLRPPLTYSQYEQRTLAQFPELHTEFATELNEYTNDQFYFRNSFMHLKSKLQLLLGQRNLNGIWVNQDMLFQEGVALAPTQKEALVKVLNQFHRNTKLKPKVMIIGDRINLLNEYVKEDMQNMDSIHDIQELQKELKSYQFIDVNTPLMNQVDAFYKTDHHYTSKGAYLCFEAFRQTILSKEPKYEYDVLPFTNEFQGTLANQSGIRKYYDTVELYFPKNCDISYLCEIGERVSTSIYDTDKGTAQNAYEIFFGGNHPLVKITSTAKNDKHLLVVKDSFANAFVPFLIPYYHRITMVDPRYYYDNIYQYIKNENVNDVLFLYSSQTLFKDSSIIDFVNTKP